MQASYRLTLALLTDGGQKRYVGCRKGVLSVPKLAYYICGCS